MKREALNLLIRLVVEERIFIQKGWGEHMPESLEKEYKMLETSQAWLERELNEMNRKEYPQAFAEEGAT